MVHSQYIEISEIDTLSGEIQNITQVEITEAASRAKMLVRENDIIVSTTRPNRGAIALIKKEQDFSIASTGFSVIRNITNSEIERDYLFAILRQFEQRSSGGNYPAITQEELSNVIIPFANAEKQKNVIKIFKNCFSQKQTNEAEAEKLLASIDDYLLGELGIALPKENYYLQQDDLNIVSEPKEEYGNYRFVKEEFKLNEQSKLVQKKRIFITNFNEVTGVRFDPHFHKAFYKEFYKNIESGKFITIFLKQFIANIYTGKGIYDYTDVGVPYLNVNNIKKYEISFENVNYFENADELDNKIYKNTIITGRVGTIGNFAIYNEEHYSLISDNVFALVFKESLIPQFANYFLNSILCLHQLKRNSRGAVQEVISTSVLKEIKIPVPPLAKQQEIAKHITNIRNQAQALKDKTKEALAKASAEIEEILLN